VLPQQGVGLRSKEPVAKVSLKSPERLALHGGPVANELVAVVGRERLETQPAVGPSWQGGNSVSFANVQNGSTLVLAVYGYTYPTVLFPTPSDSKGQPIVTAVDTGADRSVQAVAWVLHGASAGVHTWTNLPDLSTGDGKLFFAEFRNHGAPSSAVEGAGITQLDAYAPPWLTNGSVTTSAGAHAGDLLVAMSFEEEQGIGSTFTPYTDPPAGWSSLGVQNQSEVNIAGEACWRVAPGASPQAVGWQWTITGAQDPSLFKAIIFAIHAP
jgi:hypothetical protein